jgi:hypothetical protein
MRDRRSIALSGLVDAGLIVALLRQHPLLSAEDMVGLLSEQLPAGLAEAQKLAGIHNQLRHLLDVGKICNKGSRRYPKWALV